MTSPAAPNTLPESATNFLATVPGLLSSDAYEEAVNNACLDARLYGWTQRTTGAVREELARRFGRGRAGS